LRSDTLDAKRKTSELIQSDENAKTIPFCATNTQSKTLKMM